MKNQVFSRPGCPRQFNRREFISSCAVCTLGLAGLPLVRLQNSYFPAPGKKMRLHVIYSLHAEKQDRPDWPNLNFEFGPVMEKMNKLLQSRCSEFEFHSFMANGPEKAGDILQADQAENVGGYIVFQMNCWNQVINTFVNSGKPVLYADFQFGGSGGFLVYTAGFLRVRTPNIGFVASSDINELIDSVKCFNIIRQGGNTADFVNGVKKIRLEKNSAPLNTSCKTDNLQVLSPDDCLNKLKESRILAVRDEKAASGESVMGIPVEYIPFNVVNEAWEAAEDEKALQLVDHWRETANRIVDVPEETLLDSASMYLGMKSVLEKYKANAITINCLGGFYGGHIHAYPCLGFHELNNEGLVGGCECDVNSAATMLIFSTLTRGRPGYISDPVIDTGKHQIIYAHCVASTKSFGPDGPEGQFDIMTHSEDRQGASVRSYLPLYYMTTSLQVSQGRKEILMHQAKAVGNDPDDRACRTKLCAEPLGNMEKLFTMWDQWGWHRVTFYGDLKQHVYSLADKIGWKVVEEA